MTNGTANESYTFDDVGNRTSSHRSATYAYQGFNKLTSTATANYRYDANGNLVSKSEGSKRWIYFRDYENRLTMAWDRKQRVRYLYDALGRRVQRFIVGNKENTKFIYDGEDVLVDDNSGTLTKYINGDGIDNKLRVQTGNDVKYFLADHLGSTNALTDSSGNITSSASYDSFGNPTNTNFPSRYQFTGREFDNFTGLYFYRARWYDSNLGRFISEDPVGFAGGDVNLYGYVRNKPLNFFDPFGLDEYAMMERYANTRPSNRTIGEHLDELQLMLGTVGMTPGVGEPFDAVDGIISLARGNYTDAALSGMAMLPFIGSGAGITKICKKVDNLPKGGVYRLVDPDTGQVMRTGRSKDLAKRERQHAKNPDLQDYRFEPVYRTDDYPAQRGLEEVIHEKYKAPLDKILPIGPRNKKAQKYRDAAKRYLEDMD